MERVLLITGASSDIGKDYLRKYGQGYDYIFAHYRTMSEEMQSIAKDIGGTEKICMIQADLTVEEQICQMVSLIKEKGRKVTHFLHLPSLSAENRKFHKMQWDIFEKNLQLSFKSAVLILQNIIPDMVRMEYGRIVLMLSYTIETQPVLKYLSAYVTTKYALYGLVKSLASEYAAKNITINGVSPAMVNTRFIENMPDMIVQKRIEESPQKRNLEVEDVVPTIHFLLSEEAKRITGENVRITAGN